MQDVQMKWSAVEETFPQMDNQYKGVEAAYRTAVEAPLGTVKAEFVQKMDLRQLNLPNEFVESSSERQIYPRTEA